MLDAGQPRIVASGGMNRRVAGHQIDAAAPSEGGGLSQQPRVGGKEVMGEQQPDVVAPEGLAEALQVAPGDPAFAGHQGAGDGAAAAAGEDDAATQLTGIDGHWWPGGALPRRFDNPVAVVGELQVWVRVVCIAEDVEPRMSLLASALRGVDGVRDVAVGGGVGGQQTQPVVAGEVELGADDRM